MSNYYNKYLKYKNKYLNMLNNINQIGGHSEIIQFNNEYTTTNNITVFCGMKSVECMNKSKEDLYFYFEKLTLNNIDLWNKFINTQPIRNYDDRIKYMNDGKIIIVDTPSGTQAFINTLKLFNENNNICDIWIAFASSINPETHYTGNILYNLVKNLDICFTVMTEGAVSSHMGIFKNWVSFKDLPESDAKKFADRLNEPDFSEGQKNDILDISTNPIKQYKNTGFLLHAYAGASVKTKYGQTKLYMYTYPTKNMYEIILHNIKKLGKATSEHIIIGSAKQRKLINNDIIILKIYSKYYNMQYNHKQLNIDEIINSQEPFDTEDFKSKVKIDFDTLTEEELCQLKNYYNNKIKTQINNINAYIPIILDAMTENKEPNDISYILIRRSYIRLINIITIIYNFQFEVQFDKSKYTLKDLKNNESTPEECIANIKRILEDFREKIRNEDSEEYQTFINNYILDIFLNTSKPIDNIMDIKRIIHNFIPSLNSETLNYDDVSDDELRLYDYYNNIIINQSTPQYLTKHSYLIAGLNSHITPYALILSTLSLYEVWNTL